MRVAIIGSGISGTMLALRLQQLGVDTTFFVDRSPDELRAGRLPNTVGRWHHSLERERALGIDHWNDEAYAVRRVHFSAGAPLSVSFMADLETPLRAVDFRVLLPRWTEDYAERGGKLVVGPAPTTGDDIDALAAGHDLAVVAVGRGSVPALFAVDPARSPYSTPQRLVFAGLFEGLSLPEPFGVSFTIAPGVGEIFQMPFLTADGLGTNILIDAMPGGPLADLVTGPVEDGAFLGALRDALTAFAPEVAARVERRRFRVRSPLDYIQGAVTPAVRRASATLPSGTLALAVGDAWITNDPLAAQGANLGSHCAWVAAEAIAAGGTFDEAFGDAVEARMWEFAGPVTAFSNGLLAPPPPHLVDVMTAAASNPVVASAFASGFADPVRTAALLGDPDATAAFLASVARA
jgi:hypothetical protein